MIECWTNKQAYIYKHTIKQNASLFEPTICLVSERDSMWQLLPLFVPPTYLYCNLMALLVGVAWALVSTALLETNTNKCSFLSHLAPMQLSSRLDTFCGHNCSSSSLNGFSETATRFATVMAPGNEHCHKDHARLEPVSSVSSISGARSSWKADV